MDEIALRVVDLVAKRHTLPRKLAKLIYCLVAREVQGIPAIHISEAEIIAGVRRLYEGHPNLSVGMALEEESQLNARTKRIEEYIVQTVIKFCSVLERLPHGVFDSNPQSFNTTIHDLTRLSNEEIYEIQHGSSHGMKKDIFTDKNFMRMRVTALLRDFLSYRVSFDVPESIRWKHCEVIGATGFGKTTLLETLIARDILSGASVIAMTLKGNLLKRLARIVPPERLVYIGPENLIPLNVFDMKSTNTEAAVELINNIFSAGLDAETTPRQTPFINNCIRLLLDSGETIKTLYELMQTRTLPERFKPLVSKLGELGQQFFLKGGFESSEYKDTRGQILWRLDALLNNPYIVEMFCQEKTELDLVSIMDEGKVLLIDTSWAKLGIHGSTFLGRFFIALVSLAAQQRQGKGSVYFYVDEAQTYATANMVDILETAREAHVGMTLCHHDLDQFPGKIQSALLTQPAMRFVGKVNENDARAFSSILRVESGQLMHQDVGSFYLQVDGVTKRAVKIETDPKYLENLPKVGSVPKRAKKKVKKKSSPAPPIDDLNVS